ncbi:hypothetical protein [Maridesulfovibrio hydrothermalis]|uniref:Uncharacterized protein n=1 Tax=Maridesulfovibrio hydrothermalis AM13 = DSM 14728 TaxID=1121451 RepID=L0RFZ7_9BACT|nr:hypothetical protein [Maridesulfovibrio hydrothermalis]CCO24471.1 conserved exported protein of unknown function [Maridesulfovibrio hydrothermalis AM13 = DSM 14728]
MKKSVNILFFLLLIFCMSTAGFAQEKKVVPDSKTKPAVTRKDDQAVKKDGVPVVVEHVGNDVLGGTLALKLKENFRKSVLFQLADKSRKSVRIKISSRSEFTDRPEIGSVYAVIWTFAESGDVVPFYLAEEIGVVNFQNTESAAAELINKTDKIAGEYKYLFE